jgi:hypothetical protein
LLPTGHVQTIHKVCFFSAIYFFDIENMYKSEMKIFQCMHKCIPRPSVIHVAEGWKSIKSPAAVM